MADFIRVPFAVEGDVTEIPQALQTDGRVSMQTGYTFDYERDPASDPYAKDIERDKMNWLFGMITTALRQYQTVGSFPYITAAMNGGNPFPYIRGARCIYNDAIYESLVANNTSLPTDVTKWRNMSAGVDKYDIAQYYPFQDEMVREGHVPLLGLWVENFSRYTKAVQYFESEYGQKRLVTLDEYNARHVAIWHTNADGSKVGWNGEGGVNVFVWDQAADKLLVPDLAGMSWEQASAALGVGGVHGDAMRLLTATVSNAARNPSTGSAFSTHTGAFANGGGSETGLAGASALTNGAAILSLNSSRVMPTANKFQTRAWGALACVYLGLPAS